MEYYRIKRVAEKSYGIDVENCNLNEVPITAFGTDYAWAEDESITSTNSITPVLKLSMDVTNILDGTYRVDWCYNWKRSAKGSYYKAVINLNDDMVVEHIEKTSNKNIWNNNSGFNFVDIVGGDYTVKFYHFGSRINHVSFTKNLRLEFWRIS